MAKNHIKSVDHNGARITYRVTHTNAPTTVFFLHGWGGTHTSFAPLEPYFTSQFNCIFISFPQFQTADTLKGNNPLGAWKLSDFAAAAAAVLDAEEIKAAFIIGHSFGARVAVHLASRTPARFPKMLLTGAAGIPPRFNLITWLKIRLYKLKKRLLKSVKSSGSADYRSLTPVGKVTFQNIIREDLCPKIRQIATPTLLIFGRRDRSTPVYMAKKWTRINKFATLKIYQDAGHFCFIDRPERFATDALDFLSDPLELPLI